MENLKNHKHYLKVLADGSLDSKVHRVLLLFGPKSLVLVLVECALNLLNSVCKTLSSTEIIQLKKHRKFLYALASLSHCVKHKRQLLSKESKKKKSACGLICLCSVMLQILQDV